MEQNRNVSFSFYLSSACLDRLEDLSRRNDCSVASLVREAISQYLGLGTQRPDPVSESAGADLIKEGPGDGEI